MLDISYEAYHDLERFDEEIVDCLSFNQLLRLAAAIELDVRAFFKAERVGHLTFAEFATRLQALAEDSASLADLEEEVGWDLEGHLGNPLSLRELPPIALADIGVPLGVDWRSLLPTSGKQASRNADRAR
jgi:hypothetical protein